GRPFSRRERPLLAPILDTMDGRRGCRFLINGAIETWKSLGAQAWGNASFHLRPGRTGWYGYTRDSVKEFAEEKFGQMYDAIEINRRLEPADGNRIKTMSYLFPHMPFGFLSASTD